MKCKHSWKVMDKTILLSPYEQMKKNTQYSSLRGTNEFFRKKVIIILVCELCGALDKTIETN